MRLYFTDQDFFPNFYERLGIEKTASASEITRAYKKRALETHPDTNPDDVENATRQFVAIGRAYEILKNPENKRDYDLALQKRSPEAAQSSAGPNPDFTQPEFYTDFDYTEEEVRRYKEAAERLFKREPLKGDIRTVFSFFVGPNPDAGAPVFLPPDRKFIK